MTASEARQHTENSLRKNGSTELEKIFSLIKTKSINGESWARYDLDNSKIEAPLRETIIAALKRDGFTVVYCNEYDQRDGDSWNYLSISW